MKTRIGFKLREIREDRKLTQQEMAEILALSQSAYSRIERNEGAVELDDMIRYAKTLNVPVQDFMPDTMHIQYTNQNGQASPNMIMGDFHYNAAPVQSNLDAELFKQLLTVMNKLLEKLS